MGESRTQSIKIALADAERRMGPYRPYNWHIVRDLIKIAEREAHPAMALEPDGNIHFVPHLVGGIRMEGIWITRRDGKLWIERDDGEGMGCNEERLAAVLAKFFEDEF